MTSHPAHPDAASLAARPTMRAIARQLRDIREVQQVCRGAVHHLLAGGAAASLFLLGASSVSVASVPGSSLQAGGRVHGEVGAEAAPVGVDGRLITEPVDIAKAAEIAQLALDNKIAPTRSAAAGIPAGLLDAYQKAEKTVAVRYPSCQLPWWLLAGIGKIESSHASGGSIDASGVTKGPIVGPRLDGTMRGTAVVRDTDGGVLDGDPEFDRAVGPMQFLPSTWKYFGIDGDGDGKADPHNIYDATASAGSYLCQGGTRLSTPAAVSQAVLRYNASEAYVSDVLMWAVTYRDGMSVVPDSGGVVPAPVDVLALPQGASPLAAGVWGGLTPVSTMPVVTPVPVSSAMSAGVWGGVRPGGAASPGQVGSRQTGAEPSMPQAHPTDPTPPAGPSGPTLEEQAAASPGISVGAPALTAAFTAKVTGATVSFDGSATVVSPGASVVDQRWDFGDGSPVHWVAENPATHTYATAGERVVVMTVIDSLGHRSSTARRVSVSAPSAPVAAFTATTVGSRVAFDGRSSSDADGRIASWAWDFGDGSRGVGAMPQHDYARPGRYVVQLTVTDEQGATASSRHEVVIEHVNEAPVADFDVVTTGTATAPTGPDPSAPSAQVWGIALDPSFSQDPDGSIVLYKWDFGDGTKATQPLPKPGDPMLAHAYPDTAPRTVTLVAVDDQGGHSVAATKLVNPGAPRVDVAVSLTPAGALLVDASGSSPIAPGARVTAYDWDFGDATTGKGPRVEHTFSPVGRHLVTLTVTDSTPLVSTRRFWVDR